MKIDKEERARINKVNEKFIDQPKIDESLNRVWDQKIAMAKMLT
jgi:hypothetical protein